ncbi:MAG: hypothetical protein MJ197_01695 [Bacteroidales bacterium]|nr:hypothetical protein [Bacteroidales bacterium]
MTIEQRISAFASFKEFLEQLNETNADFISLAERAERQNPWFTLNYCLLSLKNITEIVSDKFLPYISQQLNYCKTDKRIALIMGGNYPFEGIIEAILILLSGNKLIARISEKDRLLSLLLLKKLQEFGFQDSICITDSFIPQFDAIIANEENATFTKYLSKFPHLLIPKQTSVAILQGNETDEDLQNLGKDIFLFWGQESRSVSKIFIPFDFTEERIMKTLDSFHSVSMHNKYMNNYEYNKSVYLVAQKQHLDNGFLLLKEDQDLKSPLAVVFYEKYSDISQIELFLEKNKKNIYSIVCNDKKAFPSGIPFGNTYKLQEKYIDNNIQFLKNL